MKTYRYLLIVVFIILASCSHQPPKPVKPEKSNQTASNTEQKTESSPPEHQPEAPHQDHQGKNIVVWADDGSKLAIAIQKNREGDNTDLSSPQHQIWTQNQDGSDRHALTDWRDYQPKQLFYMKQAGYLVVESLLEKGARRFDKITLNGNEILIVETPDSEHQACQQSPPSPEQSLPLQVEQTVIPSPDGQQLAHIYSPECGKVTVEFLHANSLNIFDNQTMTIDEAMRATWHREGYIILANYNNDKAWKVTPSAPPLPVLPPKCGSPVTTSSDISLEGQKVYLDGDTLVTEEVGRDKAFGCQ
ncbi:hypothetical protein THII_3925 [Thioploca ingrica]|uniref:Secreted protein n=1 Tax=Thioploca ingrica TaxID=40754 RepID=A0A090APK5_9GAMM|nr:hypothetical protein THII_3925 [Thioploca ingrica]